MSTRAKEIVRAITGDLEAAHRYRGLALRATEPEWSHHYRGAAKASVDSAKQWMEKLTDLELVALARDCLERPPFCLEQQDVGAGARDCLCSACGMVRSAMRVVAEADGHPGRCAPNCKGLEIAPGDCSGCWCRGAGCDCPEHPPEEV